MRKGFETTSSCGTKSAGGYVEEIGWTNHAGRHGRINLLAARIGSDGDDRHVPRHIPIGLQLSYLSCARQTVHHRHLLVHQDHVDFQPLTVAFPES